MRREVPNEYTDSVFRNKILKHEQGPVQAGEVKPPPFDWSAMPEAASTAGQTASAPSRFNLTTVLWSALVVIVLAVVAISIYNSEPEAVVEQPNNSIENIPSSDNAVTAQLDEEQKSIINNLSGDRGSVSNERIVANESGEVEGDNGTDENNGIVELGITRNAAIIKNGKDADTATDGSSGTSDHASGASLNLAPTENSDDLFGASSSTKERASEEEKKAFVAVKPNELVESEEFGKVNIQTIEPESTGISEGIIHGDESNHISDVSGADTRDDQTVARLDGEEYPAIGDDLSEGRSKIAAINLVPGRDMATSISVSDNEVLSIPGVTVTASQIQARNRFELRLFTTFNQGYRALSGNGANEKIVRRINQSESASVNFGVGLSFGWRINSRWTILTGISQRSTTINSQFSKRVIYDKTKEILNTDDNFENSAEFEFETSAGPSVAVTRYAWKRLREVLKNGDKLDFEFKFAREHSSVVIPLKVQYNIVNSGFKLGIIGGAQYARIYKSEIRADRPKALIRQNQMPMHRIGRDFFTRNTLEVLASDQKLNKNIVEASFGLYIGYQFSKSIGVYLQPSYSQGLNKIYSSGNLSTVSTNKQIDAGIVLSF